MGSSNDGTKISPNDRATRINTSVGIAGIVFTIASIVPAAYASYTGSPSLFILILSLIGFSLGLGMFVSALVGRRFASVTFSMVIIVATSVAMGFSGGQMLTSFGGGGHQGDDHSGDAGPSAETDASMVGGASVLRESGDDPIVLTEGYTVDLDSEADDWEVQTSNSGGDLYFGYDGGMDTSSDVAFLQGEPDVDRCRATTELHNRASQSQIGTGVSFCLRETTEGRVAWITVRDIRNGPNQLVLDVVVWDVSADG
jgi:hypothetical protein